MSQVTPKPVALSISGFDPSGGAGVLADLKTFAAHECYGTAALTAIQAQNMREVRKVVAIDSELLRLQLTTLFENVDVMGIKVGLLANGKTIDVIAECLAARKQQPVVLDPVFRSSNGTELFTKRDLDAYKKLLLPQARVLTPDAAEAGKLLGTEVASLDDMKGASKLLHENGVPHVVITGGHLDKPADVYFDGHEIEVFTGTRAENHAAHGTGCTFSAAVLANMIHGKAVKESVVLAKAYVMQAIARAYPIGPGGGPLNHLFRFGETPVRTGPPEVLHEEHGR